MSIQPQRAHLGFVIKIQHRMTGKS